MLKGTQNQIKIVRVTSKLSHWDLRLKCNKQDNNLQEYPELDADLRLQCNEQDNYLLEYPDLEAVLRLKSNEQNNHLQEDPDLKADMQEYTDLEVGLRLKSNEQDNHLQEYLDVEADMQEYTEEGNDFEGYREEYDETNVEESILPELHTVQQHIKVKIEINEELDSSDNLTQVKEEVLSDIDIDESENDTADFSDINIRVKEELHESQQYESTYSIFDEINKHSKEVDGIAKYFEKVNSLKIETVDEVPKSSKLDAIAGTEFSTVKCNVCLKGFLGDEAFNEHMKNHTTKDISPSEVIPSKRVVKVGNPLADNSVIVAVKKIRVKRLAKAKSNENKTTKKYFTRSSVKNIVENVVNPFSGINPKKNGTRKSEKNIVDSTSTQNTNYNSIRNDSNVEINNDSSTVKVESNKSVKINGDSGVAIDYDNDLVKVDNDSKVKVNEYNDNSTVKENKDLLIEIPGKTKVVKLPKGKRKQNKDRTKRLYNHHNVTYKVCDESCTDKKLCTQSKECRMKQRTKQYINTRFACTQCDYKGSQKHYLDKHMLIHNGVKNFHCNLCDYKCFRQCYLVRHMRAHSKNIIYSCNVCGYECVQRSQLNQHILRRHAGVKPFSCTKSKKYASRNSSKNIVDSNTIQNNNYSSVRNDNNVEVGSDNKFEVCLPPNEVGTCHLVDNNFEVGSDNKFKVDDENDSSTVKENKDLLIEMPGKTKVVKLPKGKRKQSKERTMRLYNYHNNVTYKVCDESCTDKKIGTQSKECRMKQRTKQYIKTFFACTQCDYKGSQKHYLDRHMLIHNGVKNFHCNLCDYKCFRQCYLVRHMRAHSKNITYSCNVCGYECVQRSQLNQHILRRHAGVKPFSCTKSKKYASRNSAKNIVDSNTIQNNNYSSVRNDNNVEVGSDNKFEVCLPPNEVGTCQLVDNNFEVGSDNKFKVDDENDSSTVKENKDLLIEMPGKTKVVKLPKGKRKQSKERTMRLYNHHNNVTYKVCDESCTDKKICTQSKECRMKQRTKQYIKTLFACTQCDYKGSQKHYLDRHMLIHNGVKNFHCNLCDYKCFRQCYLVRHMRAHSKNITYSCNVCGYECVQRSQLNQHILRRHAGVKPFSCTKSKKYASRNSAKNIVDSNTIQNNNYSSDRNDNNVGVGSDNKFEVCLQPNELGTCQLVDNNFEVGSDNKFKVDDENDSSTVKENKDLLIEMPGKTKVVKLPKGKRKQSKDRTKRLYNHHINVTYKVCDESCTEKKICTQSKECRMKQRTKQYIKTLFACTQCDYKGSQKHYLDRHMLIHNRVKKFHCNLCNYKCFRQCYLVRHMRAHSKNIIYSCNVCGYECVQRSQLNEHILRRHAGVKPFSCTKSKKYAARNSAKNIVDGNTIQNNNYSSDRNDNNVGVGSDNKFEVCLQPNELGTCQLVDNNFEVGSDNKFKVDDENDSSTVKETKDLLIEMPEKTKVLKLPKGKRKQSKDRTKRLYNHHNVTYKVCDESCTDKKLCTQSKECRMKQRAKQYINTRFACTQCDYKGSQKHYLDRHMLIHNGVKNFHCNLCDYKCFRQCYLVRHMRAHSKNITYSCNVCGYECVQRSQLNQHILRRHAGVKPFSCTKSKKYASRNSAKNIADSNTIQNNNYSSVRNDNNVEVGSDNKFEVCLPPNEVGTCQLVDNNFEVGSDNKFKVDDENDSSTVKENKDLLIEMPGKTKIVKLPKGKRKQSKERTMRLYNHHNNVTYKVCDESCTDKKICTQSKECRMKQRTKQYIKTLFACTQCDYKGSQKHYLDRHMLIHNGVKNFHCNLCDYKCFRQCYLVRHMRAHSKNITYSCNVCGYECVQRSQLNQHILRRHAGVKPFSCTKSKKYASRNRAKNIVDSNTIQNNNYSSDRNDNNVGVGSDNKFEVCLHPNELGTCQLFDNNFEVGSDNKFKVDDENDSSTVKENKDLLIELPGKTKVVKLPKGKRKSKERTMRLYNHHNNVTYKVCDESCTDKKLCTQSKECRMKKRIKQYINTRFACTQCDYKGSQKNHLDRHMLIHNGVKNFHCNLCDYKCVQQCHLNQHMRTHSKTKPYSCHFCDYNCVQRSQLDQHMRRHTGVKPFSCNICEYTCTQRCHLDQHMRRHTGIRPFLCIHCDYKFVQLSHLNQHIMKMHRNVQEYECSHCEYRCSQLDLLARHMRIH